MCISINFCIASGSVLASLNNQRQLFYFYLYTYCFSVAVGLCIVVGVCGGGGNNDSAPTTAEFKGRVYTLVENVGIQSETGGGVKYLVSKKC